MTTKSFRNQAEEMKEAIARQGDHTALDETHRARSEELKDQMRGESSDEQSAGLPFMWGTIRLIAVNGKPSVWRKRQKHRKPVNAPKF